MLKSSLEAALVSQETPKPISGTVNYLKGIKSASRPTAPLRSESSFPADLLEVGGPDVLSNLSHFISLAGSLAAATPPPLTLRPPPFLVSKSELG